MKMAEFKAWFDGFTEGLDGKPTEKQWERIKARVAEINGESSPAVVYVDRGYPMPYRQSWPYGGVICNSAQTAQAALAQQAFNQKSASSDFTFLNATVAGNASVTTWDEIGRLESRAA